MDYDLGYFDDGTSGEEIAAGKVGDGQRIAIAPVGEHSLKGIQEKWQLYKVRSAV
jgi:hypothetical protein